MAFLVLKYRYRYILFIGIRTLFDRVTRGYGYRLIAATANSLVPVSRTELRGQKGRDSG